eukprot:779464-Alexandrium_andersonii.AAC.1
MVKFAGGKKDEIKIEVGADIGMIKLTPEEANGMIDVAIQQASAVRPLRQDRGEVTVPTNAPGS